MPVHRCSFDVLEETVERIEASNERIISVVAPTDSSCVIVTYEPGRRVNVTAIGDAETRIVDTSAKRGQRR